jgi:HD-GYP domain-containing protein (c-di-GMP phosphodiesterase class II)
MPVAALEELRRAAGTQFDPAVVAALQRVLQSAPGERAAVLQPVASRSATSNV